MPSRAAHHWAITVWTLRPGFSIAGALFLEASAESPIKLTASSGQLELIPIELIQFGVIAAPGHFVPGVTRQTILFAKGSTRRGWTPRIKSAGDGSGWRGADSNRAEHTLATTIWAHLPSTIPRTDEAI
jgi:hypothetical protein